MKRGFSNTDNSVSRQLRFDHTGGRLSDSQIWVVTSLQ